MSGHAVEARLYAEDPARGFRPSVGNVIACDFASTPGVRVERACDGRLHHPLL